MKKFGRKYVEASKKLDKNTSYSVSEAIHLAKETSVTNFDGTVDFAMKLNVDPKKADQQLRGSLVLPNGTGKTKRVLVIAKGAQAEAAKAAGALYVGEKDMIEKIQKENWFEFDVLITTPDMMGLIGRMGKILGPKGLMPNPKSGTVTMDVTKAVHDVKAGKVEYRVDKQAVVHVIFGKKSFGKDKLVENATTVMDAIIKAKPASAKGTYLKSVAIATTMGPGIKVLYK